MADNTASLVVALSAQLTKFENDMKRAGVMAGEAVDDIEKKFGRMNPQVSSSFLGNFFADTVSKGIEAATKAILAFKDRFIELDKQAKVTGESMEALWGFQQAAAANGATIENALKGLREMANLLNQMQRGESNTLSQLFDVNPNALAGLNRQTMTVQQSWEVIANLVRNANTEFDKIDILRLAGFSEDMVKAFERGGPALKAIVDAASQGAPALSQMAEQAKLFDSYMKSASEWIKADLAQGLQNTKREIIAILSIFEKGGLFTGGPLEGLGGGTLEKLRATEKAAKDLTRVTITGDRSTRIPVKPAGGAGDTQSAFDRQNDQITKHIALMEADTAAVGLNVGEQERLRTVALLKTAAERDGIPITAEMSKQIEQQASAAAKAKLQLAEATDKLQKLNAASQIVGSALSSAFADAIVEGKALSEVVSSLIKTLEKAAINALVMNLFSPGGTGGVSPILKAIGFAGGTDFAPGGLAVVGERGPELVNLPRGSQVIPNNVARGMSGGGSITYAPAIDARGASVEAVARLAQIMEMDRATFASRTVATIQSARRGRVPGL